jgi:hypothetical protein
MEIGCQRRPANRLSRGQRLVRLQDSSHIVVGYGSQALQRPVFADLAQPTHAPVLGGVEISLSYQLVKRGRLIDRVVAIVTVRLGQMEQMMLILLLYPSPDVP